MAGDWIKMRTDLATSPKVVRISSALRADRFRTVGALHAVWCLFDAHSLDGKLEGYNLGTVDDLIGFTGFAEAMASVGWLVESAGSLELPRFDDHNGSSAKRRAMESDRKRKGRLSASDADVDADELRTREEERREEEESKAIVPSADDTSGYSSEFEQFWKAYPKRDGGNSKKGAFKAWKARLRAGAKVDDLILSASRYAEHMAVQGLTGTSFVKQASTFLGPDDHWQEALTSNVHPIAQARNGSRPALKPGEFYDFDWDDKNPATHKIYHSDTHDPTTGYAWVWLKKQTWYRP